MCLYSCITVCTSNTTFPLVYSCNIIVGNGFWMDWTRLLKLTETSNKLVWTGTQIGDSSEEVEKWAENPDIGSPNIQ